MSEGKVAILTAVIAGLAALAGTILGGMIKSNSDLELAKQKFYADLVLKALESSSPDERLKTLQMLTSTHLIADTEIQKGVAQYVADNIKSPGNIPQVGLLGAPLVSNARIYLLAGTPQRAEQFSALKLDLIAAKYNVLDSKILHDAGRPDQPEIRYFNASDQTQAEKLSEYMKFKDPQRPAPARQLQDPSAKPGYIEIWLGR